MALKYSAEMLSSGPKCKNVPYCENTCFRQASFRHELCSGVGYKLRINESAIYIKLTVY